MFARSSASTSKGSAVRAGRIVPRFFRGALPALISLFLPYPALADYVYLTKNEALDIALGKDCTIEYRELELSDALFDRLEEENLEPQEGRSMHLFTCRKNGAVDGYAFIDSQVGKHLPITYIVGLNRDGSVRVVEVMIYREEYGAAVKERHFEAQFEGKKDGDPLKVGTDIKNISGATLSSRAMAVGVRRAVIVFKEMVGGEP